MTELPALPEHAALLLDLDGTLLDLAPTPDEVVVPPDLPGTLRHLRDRLGNALAVVTGRPVAQIEALLGDAPYAIAGEHGGAVRPAPGAALVRAELPELPAFWLDQAAGSVAAHPGALLEPKPRGFVFHYRLAPDAGPALEAAAHAIIAARASAYSVLAAHMAWEIRPRGVDKGTAVANLMRAPPFAGRVPVYLGDDVTDEDAMRVAVDAGGLGLRVSDVFGSPAGVRAWLADLAATL